jgi:hypothetical protein
MGRTDGRTIERDLSHLLPAPSEDTVFTPWHDPSYLAQVRVNEDWARWSGRMARTSIPMC